MEDRQVVDLHVDAAKKSVYYLLKFISICIDEVRKLNEGKVYSGETSWNKFVKTLPPKDIKTFQATEVNLDKLKNELDKYGIGFAFYKHLDGDKVDMTFYSKDTKFVESALKKVIDDLVKGGLTDRIKATKEDMTISEKLNHFREESITNPFKSAASVKLEAPDLSVFKDGLSK